MSDVEWADLFDDEGELRSIRHVDDACEECEARQALWSAWFEKPDGCAMPTRRNANALYREALPQELREP